MNRLIIIEETELRAMLAEFTKEIFQEIRRNTPAAQPPDKSPWMTGPEVREYLRISENTLRNRVKAGYLKQHFIKGRAHGVYSRAEVEKLG